MSSHSQVAPTIDAAIADAQARAGDIAIIGMACRFPGADGPDAFWQLMCRGESSVSEVPAERWDAAALYSPNREDENRSVSRWGGFIADADKFDAALFRISPREAELMDPQQRVLLELAWACIEDAGYAPSTLRGSDTGVYIGFSNSDYKSLVERALPAIEAHLSTGVHGTLLPNRISYEFDFKGPSVPVDTACSSSLVALDQAVHALQRGDCAQALVGGVSLLFSPTHFISFSKAGMLSAEGKCKTFDEDADGYVRGEGAGLVLLKPLAQALQDGDAIHGVIKGTAVNHGGKVASVTSPNPFAQAQVITRALRRAGVSAARISYIEAQGTGTPKGDPLEITALVRAFGALARSEGIAFAPGACGLGTVKTNIGHLEPASGMAGLIKVLLAMRHGALPALVHFRRLNPRIRLEGTPFRLITEHCDWPADADGLRRAGVSSFGFGGVNAHVVIESFQQSATAAHDDASPEPWAFPVSAKNAESLRRYVERLVEMLATDPTVASKRGGSHPLTAAALAASLQRREAMEERLVVVADSCAGLCERLQDWLAGRQVAGVVTGTVRKGSGAGAAVAADGGASDPQQQAVAWTRGLDVTWSSGDAGEDSAAATPRLRLPTYQFTRKRYWFEHGEPLLPAPLVGVAMADSAAAPVAPEGWAEPVAAQPMAPAPAPADAQLERLQRQLLQLAAQQLKQSPDVLDVRIELSEYGFDSIAYTGFASRISSRFGIELAPTVFFDHPTIAGISAYLWAHHRDHVAPSATAPAPPPRVQSAASDTVCSVPAAGSLHAQPAHGETAGAMPVAIIGMSGTFPMARDLDEFWRNLEQGRDCIGEVPAERWDWQAIFGDPTSGPNRCNVKWGGFIDGVDEFDPLFFGISPREAVLMDPQQRLLMMHVWRVIEDAGYAPASLAGSNTGVFVGTASLGYENLITRANLPIEGYSATAIVPSVGPNRMSFLLDLHGPSEPVETACSSSLVAIHRAVMAMQAGECDQAIVGGVNTIVTPDFHISFNKAGMLAPDGRCKTFSSQANGYVRGEGVGMLFLKPLAAAELDGDHIHGVIRGSAENHGGRANSLTSPNSRAQADVLVKAHLRAGVDPRTVGYLEAHGTGTSLGDPVEINGMRAAFKALYEHHGVAAGSEPSCALASVKTNIGHLEIAAGVAGVIKVLLQFRHRRIAPSLHCEEINPLIDLSGTPFYIAREATDWPAMRDADGRVVPRRAGVSSFGFGGVNAHVVLEEYVPATAPAPRSAQPEAPALVVLSARTGTALRDYAASLAAFVDAHPEASLRDLAYTLQVGRKPLEERLAVVAPSLQALAERLRGFLDGRSDLDDVYVGQAAPHRDALAALGNDEDMQATLLAWHAKGKFARLLGLWTKGIGFDWELLYRDLPVAERPRRISAPTYPFARERYWVGMAVPGTPKTPAPASAPVAESTPAAAQTCADDVVLQALRALQSGALDIAQATDAVARPEIAR